MLRRHPKEVLGLMFAAGKVWWEGKNRAVPLANISDWLKHSFEVQIPKWLPGIIHLQWARFVCVCMSESMHVCVCVRVLCAWLCVCLGISAGVGISTSVAMSIYVLPSSFERSRLENLLLSFHYIPRASTRAATEDAACCCRMCHSVESRKKAPQPNTNPKNPPKN